MSHLHHKIQRKRDAFLPLSGSVVESDPTPTASLLAQDSGAAGAPGPPATDLPFVASAQLSSYTTTTQSSIPTTTANTTASSRSRISLGAVVGACVAALVVLLLAVLLAFYCSKRQKWSTAHSRSRNVVNNHSRRRSRLEPWKRINDDADQHEGQERPMTQRPLSGPIGAMFQRSISNASGDKSSEAHNRESIGTMRHFAKYHPGLAAEMASQSAVTAVDGKVTKPEPVLHLVGRGTDVKPTPSWDGDTVGGGESFISLHSSLSTSSSPFMLATAKATPPAMTSSLHHWESAEVVHVGQVGTDSARDGELPNPFADRASSIRSSIKAQNPFFSGRVQPARRTLLAGAQKNPFADPDAEHDSSAAILSLIAALQDTTGRDNDDRIISVQSSLYSRMTADDADSAISVTAFPYPPTQVNVR